jgi:hypothetical protein
MRRSQAGGAALLRGGRFVAMAGAWAFLNGCVPEELDANSVDDPISPSVTENSGATAGDGGVSEIVVAPESLDFGTSTEQLLLVLGHDGESPFSYTIDCDADWVTIDEPSARTRGTWAAVRIGVDRTGLTLGEHTATLSVDIPDQPRHTVGVSAIVTEWTGQENLYVSAQQLDFGYQSESRSLLVGSLTDTELGYTLASDVTWAAVSPTSGFSDGAHETVAVTVSRSGLGPGLHTGLLGIEASNGETRHVSLLVAVADADEVLPPALETSTNLLEFGTQTTTLAFDLHNSGGGSISYNLVSPEDWLAFSPPQGETSGETDTIAVTVDRAGLAPGSHVAPIEIVADDGVAHELWASLIKLDPNEPSPEQIAAWLAELDPLPKVHYAFNISVVWHRNGIDPRLREFVRIAHAMSISAEWLIAEDLNVLVGLCKEINDTDPAIPARLGINYSPWHYVFPEGYPPTYDGPEVEEEIARCRMRLENVRDWLAAANANHDTNVEVGAVLFDTEIWYKKEPGEPGWEEWNAALDDKYNAMYLVSKDVFPDASVNWYARGQYWVGQAEHIYLCRRFTLNELGDSYSVSLYRLPELGYTRQVFRQTAELAETNGVASVIPWIALGSGYRRETEDPDGSYWQRDWDFDLFYAWQIGAEVNDPWYGNHPNEYAPWHAADVVAFYPPPLHARTPAWGKHFVAYVRGAHGIPDLPE